MAFPQPNVYQLERLDIITEDEVFEIQDLFEFIDIYEDIETPYIIGNILIKDTVLFIEQLNPTSGDTFLRIVFKSGTSSKEAKADAIDLTFDRTFRITAIQTAQKTKPGESRYMIEFISNEFVLNLSKKISRGFRKLDPGKAIEAILRTDLQTEKEFVPGTGFDSIDIVMPYKHPFEAISWIKRIAIKEGHADAMFFEYSKGYRFESLLRMITGPEQVHEFYETPEGTPASLKLQPFNSVEDVYPADNLSQNLLETFRTGQRGLNTYGYNRVSKTLTIDPELPVSKPAHDSGTNDRALGMRTRMADIGQLKGRPVIFSMHGNSARLLGDAIVFERAPGGAAKEFRLSTLYSGRYMISKINHRISRVEYIQLIEGWPVLS